MRTDNRDRWYDRMARAARLLSERVDDPPSLDELASAAAVSPYHFHRIWRGLTGETVGETLGRLRIEMAQGLLASGGTSVTEVAMATGFSSSQSFARAFKGRTGVPPSDARGAVAAIRAPAAADVRFVAREGLKVVALRRIGGEYVALNALFQQVWDWAEAAARLDQLTGLYGIPLDDPASVPVSGLRYDACLALGDADPPSPLRLHLLPDGLHAQLRHVGSYDALEALDQWLVGAWLPTSGYEPADAPLYHHFHNDPDTTPEEELVTDILLPLQQEENA